MLIFTNLDEDAGELHRLFSVTYLCFVDKTRVDEKHCNRGIYDFVFIQLVFIQLVLPSVLYTFW